tara:strand:+ start:886 stop:1011 length:126 start_codon:yes stop_codon:yes gene_type:complete
MIRITFGEAFAAMLFDANRKTIKKMSGAFKRGVPSCESQML